jgi:hypothetical protein
MTKEDVFASWAPDISMWSNWVKPVLFAQLEPPLEDPAPPAHYPFNLDWASAYKIDTAVVADLPGPVGVHFGLAMAKVGFRPVPLYNAVMGPPGDMHLMSGTYSIALVEVQPTIDALIRCAADLATVELPRYAPPVFLMNWHRLDYSGPIYPGRFDNRSISFPSDFPSGDYLMQNGIKNVVVLQLVNGQPRDDLSSTLMAWQKAGVTILTKNLNHSAPPTITRIKPAFWRWLWYRLLAIFGLHRQPSGGFGAMIQAASG